MLQGTCIWYARLCTALALHKGMVIDVKGMVPDDHLMIEWYLFIDKGI